MSVSPDWLEGPASRNLRVNVAHVWRILIAGPLDPFHGVLTAEELSRATRFHSEEGRAQFVASRGALRILIARYLSCEPKDVSLETNPHGKPFLPGNRLNFNLAHSHQQVLLAFTLDAAIGIDLEWRAGRTDLEAVAPEILAPNELQLWRELPEHRRRQSFFWHWTAKEAYLKALGVGLSKDPRTIQTSSLPARELSTDEDYAAAMVTLGDALPEVQQFTFSA